MPYITLDLETIPCQNEEQKNIIKSKVAHPKTMKVQKTIDVWEADKRPQAEEDAILKTSFAPLYGEIIVIGFAIEDGKIQSISRTPGETEGGMLQLFWSELKEQLGVNDSITWIGHNVANFDIPFLYNRCMINNVKPVSLPRNPKPWGRDVFDTLYEVMGNNSAGGSLDAIARALGIGQKTEGMDGSQVWPEYQKGNIEKIASYCRGDVKLTREIYKRILFIDSVENNGRPEYLN